MRVLVVAAAEGVLFAVGDEFDGLFGEERDRSLEKIESVQGPIETPRLADIQAHNGPACVDEARARVRNVRFFQQDQTIEVFV